jgi:hypothetical protein
VCKKSAHTTGQGGDYKEGNQLGTANEGNESVKSLHQGLDRKGNSSAQRKLKEDRTGQMCACGGAQAGKVREEWEVRKVESKPMSVQVQEGERRRGAKKERARK